MVNRTKLISSRKLSAEGIVHVPDRRVVGTHVNNVGALEDEPEFDRIKSIEDSKSPVEYELTSNVEKILPSLVLAHPEVEQPLETVEKPEGEEISEEFEKSNPTLKEISSR